MFKLENSLASHNMYTRRITDPLMPPLRTPEHRTPINVPTRGYNPQYQQIGVLFSQKDEKTLPLYGKPTYQDQENGYIILAQINITLLN